MASSPTNSDPWVNWGKALASQLIVWHHLLIYGPLAPAAEAAWPAVTDFVQQHGRLAVQVFLVIGGYLGARSLWPAPGDPRVSARAWPARVWARYRRLLPMLALALLLAVLAAAIARAWMQDADTPAAPGWPQLLAHVLLLQDIVGQPALSAGVWYVAIDLELFALLAALAALAQAAAGRAPAGGGRTAVGALLLVPMVAASLLWFNRQAGGDAWAPYFFGAYGLGVLAAWGRGSGQRAGVATLIGALLALALLLEWRSRVALAGGVALLLLLQPGARALACSRLNRLMVMLASMSYAVFLLHYPLSLLVNALVVHWTSARPAIQIAGLWATWVLSLTCGWLAWHWLEARPLAWRQLVAMPALRATKAHTR